VTLTSTQVNREVRVTKWHESYKHYTDDHSGCHHGLKSTEWWMRIHGGRPDDIEDLQEFFRVTSTIFDKVHRGLDTNGNEILDVIRPTPMDSHPAERTRPPK
jgi:hypothetical protein